MSTTIDERVVGLKFDNDQFEKNVKQSMDTLGELDKQLDKSGSSSGFSSFSGAVDTAEGKLSSLFEVASRYITEGIFLKLGSQIEEMGVKLVKSLSVDQITSGFSKYEEYTTGIQTILSAVESKGKTLDDVTVVMDKLSWYADETSASLTDMVSSIGKFTSSGVDLDKATTAIEGISNWAYYSGKNINEASRAMYNLSQSLGTGSVRLTDWMSIENVNMNTESFIQNVLDTATALGTLTKEGEKYYVTSKGVSDSTEVTTANFRSMLQTGFFTSDVLIEVLSKYANATDKINEIFNEVTEENSTILTSSLIELAKGYEGNTEALRDQLDAWGLSEDVIADVIEQFDYFTTEEGQFGITTLEAAQSTKTFSEAISSVKDAVSSGWMTTFQIIIGNLDQAKERISEITENLWTIFAGGAENRNNWLNDIFNSPVVEDWGTSVEATKTSVDKLNAALVKLAKQSGVSVKLEDGTTKVVESYSELEQAIEQGATSFEHLKELATGFLDSGGFDLEVVTETTSGVTDAFETLRTVALETLNGKHGDGQARIDELTELGYSAEAVQTILEAADATAEQSGWNRTEQLKHISQEEVDEIAALSGVTIDWANSVSGVSEATENLSVDAQELIDYIDNLGFAEDKQAEVVSEIAGMTGADLLWGSVNNILEAIGNTLTGLREAFGDVFGDPMARGVKGFLTNLYLVTARIKDITKGAENFKAQFTAVFTLIRSVLSLIKTLVSGVVSVVKTLFSGLLKGLGQSDISFAESVTIIAGWVTSVKEAIESSELLQTVLGLLSVAAESLGKGIDVLVSCFSDLKSTSGPVSEKFGALFSSISDGTFTVEALWDTLDSFFSWIKTSVKGAGGSALASLTTTVDGQTTALGSILQGFEGTVLGVINSVIGFFDDLFGTNSEPITTLSGFVEAVKNTITAIFKDEDGTINGILTNSGIAALAIFLINLSGLVSSLMAPLKAAASLVDLVAKSVSGLITGVGRSLKGVIKSYKKDISANILLKLASSILILVAAMGILVKAIPQEKIWPAVEVIAALGAILMAMMAVMSLLLKNSNLANKFMMIGVMFAGIGAAFLTVAVALKVIGKIRDANLAKALVIMATFMLGMKMLLSTMRGISLTGMNVKSALGFFIEMVALIVGLMAMVKLLRILKDVNMFTEIIWGIAKLAVMVGAIYGLFAVISTGDEVVGKAGINILALSAGVLLLTVAINALKNIKLADFAVDLLKIAGLAAIIAGLVYVMGLAKVKRNNAGSNILKMSVGLLVMVGVLKALISTMTYDEFVVGYEELLMLSLVVAALTFVTKYAGDVKGTPILQLAVLLSAVTVAVLALRKIVNADLEGTLKTVGVVLALMAGLAILVASTTKITDDGSKTILSLTALVVAIGVMMGITVLALQTATDFETPRITIRAFAILLGAIAGVMTTISKVGKADKITISEIARYIIIIAFLAGLVLESMALLNNLRKTSISKDQLNNVIAFATILGSIGIVASAIAFSFGSSNMNWSDALFAVGMFAAVALVARIIAETFLPAMAQVKTALSGISFKEMETMILYIFELLLVIATVSSLVAVAIGKTNTGGLNAQSAAGFAIIAAALVVVMGLCAGLAVLINYIPPIQTNIVSKILATAAILAVITVLATLVATSLGKIEGKGLNNQNVGSFILIAGVLTAIMLAVVGITAWMNTISINAGILTKVAAVSLMTAAIAGLALAIEAALNKMTSSTKLWKKIGVFSVMALVITLIALAAVAIVSAASTLPSMNGDLLTKVVAIGTITVVITALALLLSVASKSIGGFNGGAMGTILASFVFIIALSAVTVKIIKALNKLQINSGFIEKVEVFETILLELAVIGAVVGYVAGILSPLTASLPQIGAAIGAIFIIALAIITIVGVLAGIAWVLAELDGNGLQARLDHGFDILGTITEGIGSAIGKLISGFTGFDGIEDFGDKIVDLGKDMNTFANTLSGINTEASEGVKNISEAILNLTGAEFLDAITTFITTLGGSNGAASFANACGSLGNALSNFALTAGNIDDNKFDKVDKAVPAIEKMVGAMKLIPADKPEWLAWIIGDTNVSSFASGFSALARGIADMATALDGTSFTSLGKVTKVSDAISTLAEVDKNLANHYGLGSDWVGDQTLMDFATALVGDVDANGNKVDGVIDKLVEYAKAADELNDTVDETGEAVDYIAGIEQSVTALEKLAAVETELEAHGGLFQKIGGDQSLGNLGENLTSLATGLSDFVTNTTGISAESVEKPLSALIAFETIERSLASVGDSLKTASNGAQNLGDLGKNLEDLGNSIQKFYNATSGITDEEWSRITAYASYVAAMENAVTASSIEGEQAAIDAAAEAEVSAYQSVDYAAAAKDISGTSSTLGKELTANATASGTEAGTAGATAEASSWASVFGSTMMGLLGSNTDTIVSNAATIIGDKFGLTEDQVSSLTGTISALTSGEYSAIEATSLIADTLKGFDIPLTSGQVDTLSACVQDLMAVLGYGESTTSGAADGISEVGTAAQDAGSKASLATDLIGAGLSLIGSKIDSNLGDGATEKIKSAISSIVTSLANGETDISGVSSKLSTELASLFPSIDDDTLNMIVNTALPYLEDMLSSTASSADKATESINASTEALEENTQAYADNADVASSSSTNILGSLGSMVEALTSGTFDESTIQNIGTAVSNLASSAETSAPKIQAFTNSVTGVVNAISSFDTSSAQGVADSISSVGTAVDAMVNATVLTDDQKSTISTNVSVITSEMVDAISGSGGDESVLSSAISQIITDALSSNGAEAHKGEATAVGSGLSENVASGIKSEAGSVSSAASGTTSAGVSGVRSRYYSFYSAGGYVIDGLVKGVKSRVDEALQAGIEIGDAVEMGFRDYTITRSPSRLFMKLGAYLVDGLSIGIDRNASSAYDSSAGLGEYAEDGFRTALNTINRVLDDDGFGNPTITPVLDLSDVKAGAAKMASMLDGSALGINTGFASRAAGSISKTIGEGVGASGTNPSGNSVILNVYAKSMSKSETDYLISEVNRRLGARV